MCVCMYVVCIGGFLWCLDLLVQARVLETLVLIEIEIDGCV